MSKQGCIKTLLASHHGMQVYFCQTCKVVHLELGAVSLRMDPEVMLALQHMLQSANASLDFETSCDANRVAKEHADSLIQRLRKS